MPIKSDSYGGLGHHKRGRGRAVRSRSGNDASLLKSGRTNLNRAVVPPKSKTVKAVPKLQQPKKAPPKKKAAPKKKAPAKKCTCKKS